MGGRHDVLRRIVVVHENKDNGGKHGIIRSLHCRANVGGIYAFGILAVNYQMFEMYQLSGGNRKMELE